MCIVTNVIKIRRLDNSFLAIQRFMDYNAPMGANMSAGL